ncbi:hypothetical protein L2E82_39917 [Cichorium intybus]|uniref:Uncharacterized protein n=1 Tax=Cichorium intybus TaxID=13427 RepID=A0ACB9AJW6_CICIN|nr:hypothetical protein L2E82_39917 [Cichorium intybus]
MKQEELLKECCRKWRENVAKEGVRQWGVQRSGGAGYCDMEDHFGTVTRSEPTMEWVSGDEEDSGSEMTASTGGARRIV